MNVETIDQSPSPSPPLPSPEASGRTPRRLEGSGSHRPSAFGGLMEMVVVVVVFPADCSTPDIMADVM